MPLLTLFNGIGRRNQDYHEHSELKQYCTAVVLNVQKMHAFGTVPNACIFYDKFRWCCLATNCIGIMDKPISTFTQPKYHHSK
jgi:hypothetical protein